MIATMKVVLLLFLVKSISVSTSIGMTCGVVPIKVWGGSPSRLENDLSKPVDLVVVAHTVTDECMTDAECEQIAISIRRFSSALGVKDIGLSFLIGGNGKVYEGAGWKVGGHTWGYNDKSISLSFLGDFREKLPTENALRAAEDFLACFLNTEYLDSEYSLVGQRQLIPTVSPGDALQEQIETWPHWTENVPSL